MAHGWRRRAKQSSRWDIACGWLPSGLLPAPRRALVVVDVQQGYYRPNAGLRRAFPDFASNVQKTLALARNGENGPGAFDLIVHVRAGYSLENGSLMLPQFVALNPDKRVVLPGSEDALPENFARAAGETPDRVPFGSASRRATRWAPWSPPEVILDKPSFDAFLKTPLDDILREYGIEELFICGMLTSVCVQATAHSAFAHGYRPVMLTDVMADRSRARHDAVLSLYAGYMYQVATVSDLEALVAQGEGAPVPDYGAGARKQRMVNGRDVVWLGLGQRADRHENEIALDIGIQLTT